LLLVIHEDLMKLDN